MTIDLILRIMAATAEQLTLVLEKATPEQIGPFLERHNARMERLDKVLTKLNFWD